MRIIIDKKNLDDKIKEGTIKLEGGVFAYIPNSDNGKPSYSIFSKTHNKQWGELTKDFDPTKDWRKLLEGNPELKKKLSDEVLYGVPPEALEIPHGEGGHHGDLRLRYKNANLIFFPIEDYYNFFRLEDTFLANCKILYVENGKEFIRRVDNTLIESKGNLGKLFLKGNKRLLSRYGVHID